MRGSLIICKEKVKQKFFKLICLKIEEKYGKCPPLIRLGLNADLGKLTSHKHIYSIDVESKLDVVRRIYKVIGDELKIEVDEVEILVKPLLKQFAKELIECYRKSGFEVPSIHIKLHENL